MGASWEPKEGCSYAAGTILLCIPPKNAMPSTLLVLQRPGEEFAQRNGGTFTRPRIWKFPMGRFDKARDRTILDTVQTELLQETGRTYKHFSMEHSVSSEKDSERPGSNRHANIFFLAVVGSELPMEPNVALDENEIIKASWFKVNKLPIRGQLCDGAELSWSHYRTLKRALSEVGYKLGLTPAMFPEGFYV